MANLFTGVTMEYKGDVSGKLLYTPLFRNPGIERFFTLLDGVQSRTNLPIAGALRKITKKDPGCGLTETGAGVTISERLVEPVKMYSFLQHCPAVFDNTVFEKMRRAGYDINNIEGTELEQIVLHLVGNALQDDLFRQVFFSDTALSDANYNSYNGVWKRLMADAALGNIMRTDTLGAGPLADCAAKDILRNLIRSAPNTLKQIPKSKAMILVSGSIFDNLLDCKLDQSAASLTALERLENGNGDVTEWETQWFEGYKVIAMRGWDTWIDDLGQNTPHRAVLWVPENHFIATDTAAAYNQIKVWYSHDDDLNKTLARYMIAYNYALPQLITVAY